MVYLRIILVVIKLNASRIEEIYYEQDLKVYNLLLVYYEVDTQFIRFSVKFLDKLRGIAGGRSQNLILLRRGVLELVDYQILQL